MTYAVDPLRQAVFQHLDVPAALLARFNPGITWNGWQVPVALELAIAVAMGVGLLGVAIAEFRRGE